MKTSYLVLSDGSIYPGQSFGAATDDRITVGEVVFATSMTGYQEMLTDPSFAGQILVPTYPLQGNYGTSSEDVESSKIQVSGFAVRDISSTPSHYNNIGDIDSYLRGEGILGIWGIDTRAVARRIRSQGVMMGAISTGSPEKALENIRQAPAYDSLDFVSAVTTSAPYEHNPSGSPHVAIIDCGLKRNIVRELVGRGCHVTVLPAHASAQDVMLLQPDSVLFSPGPGDPVHNIATVETAKTLIGVMPIMGICLGHQIVARALGAETFKLKFGHRGANHPVKDLVTGRVSITSQNHGYAVSEAGMPRGLDITHKNLNDGTIEGLRHREASILTIQYHSEASPGPLDNGYLFDEFLNLIKDK